jgi:hypothetical protein
MPSAAIGKLEAVDVDAVLPARAYLRLATSGSAASSRWVNTIGEIAQPLLASALINRGGGDREAITSSSQHLRFAEQAIWNIGITGA